MVLPALLALPLLAGCETALNSGHVVSVTERVYGLKVAEAVANETPEVELGFSSTTVVLMPTITNATLNVPAIADTFTMDQTSALGLNIGEAFSSQTYEASDTNQRPIIPTQH